VGTAHIGEVLPSAKPLITIAAQPS
jgi:hypothetical protein